MNDLGNKDLGRLAARLECLLATRAVSLDRVAGNWGLTLYRAESADGRFAVKTGRPWLPAHLETEARMLADLHATGFPVPRVIATDERTLVTEWVDNDGAPLRPIHERAAAEALAALHAVPRPSFGYGYPTQFGALMQPNSPAPDWTSFFRDRRLVHFASLALDRRSLEPALHSRLLRLADRLDRFCAEPAHPALLHDDVWTGNILTDGPGLRAIVDPALFCGHPEYELAYVTLHGTFGAAFFDAYAAHHPIAPGFARLRRDLYLLVPLLQHAVLSGPVYLHRIDRILAKLGF